MSDAEAPGIEALTRLARGARRIVAFTGAGISTESGIPDYRGPGGVWERNAPPTLSDFRTSEETRKRYWLERKDRYPALRNTIPNSGHMALVCLQDAGLLSAVITQNIDGLHQKSGIEADKVIELHGSAHRVRCLDCGTVFPADVVQYRLVVEPLPACQECEGMLRASTILFGEPLSDGVLRRAIEASSSCDLMLVVGSSLVVQPAARLPGIAVASGARMAVINRDPTPLDHLANVVVQGGAGNLLMRFVEELLGRGNQTGAGWQTGQ